MFKGKRFALVAIGSKRTIRVLALSDDLDELIEKAKKSIAKQNRNFVDSLQVIERKIENNKYSETKVFKIDIF
jgi:hypothetical protein